MVGLAHAEFDRIRRGLVDWAMFPRLCRIEADAVIVNLKNNIRPDYIERE